MGFNIASKYNHCVTGRENNWADANVKLNDDCEKAKNGIVFPVRVHAERYASENLIFQIINNCSICRG